MFIAAFEMHSDFVKDHVEGNIMSDRDFDGWWHSVSTGSSCEELDEDNSESDSTECLPGYEGKLMHLSMSPPSPRQYRGFDKVLSVKFSSTGAKKPHYVPRGVSIRDLIYQ